MHRARFLLLLPTIAVLGCQPGDHAIQDASAATPATAEDVRPHIEAANRRIGELVSRGAFDSIAELYASDAVMLAPNMPPLVGVDSVRSFWIGARDMGARSLELETTDVQVSGDFAVETGRYTFGLQPQGAAAVTDRGKFLVVWKRQADGGWKIYRDIFNTSMPVSQ